MFNFSNWSYRNLLYAGLAVYTVCAFFSEGYHHPDEHFQILEFANYKLGNTPAVDMPWEFWERIRPALQPALALWVIKGLKIIGLSNPFSQVFLLRLCSGVFACLLFSRMSQLLDRDFLAARTGKLLLAATFLLWFMPYLHVRFSSENWASLSFLYGIYFILLPENKTNKRLLWHFLFAGILLGLSFFFRFQMAFAIIGVAAWMLFQQRVKGTEFVLFVLGGLTSVALGVAIDFWFYDAVVFTPWEYFKSNILLGKAAGFGISPWWYYVPEFIVRAIPPVSLALLGLAGLGIYLKPRHLFTWALIPFLLAHFAVAHKEMRFLFPMVFPFLFFVLNGWEYWKENYVGGKIYKIIVLFLMIINGLAFLLVCTQPAQVSIRYFRFLYHYAEEKPVTLYAEKESPYRLAGLYTSFYTAHRMEVRTVVKFADLADGTSFKLQEGDLLLSRRLVLDSVFSAYTTKRLFTNFPDWLMRYDINDWQERTRIWSIYRVEKGRMNE